MFFILMSASFFAWKSLEKKHQTEFEKNPAFMSLKIDDGQRPYTDLDGNPVTLTEYVGEALIVTSWASWCPSCEKNLSNLSKVIKEYEDKNVRVLAVNRAEPAKTAQLFLKTIDATPNIILVLDPDDNFFKSINGYTVPETLFYDFKGSVIFHAHGLVSIEEMRKYVDLAISNSDAE
jgi:thiol-disulfide isomerase/thioredoxin